jgi:hypothetical protein
MWGLACELSGEATALDWMQRAISDKLNIRGISDAQNPSSLSSEKQQPRTFSDDDFIAQDLIGPYHDFSEMMVEGSI